MVQWFLRNFFNKQCNHKSGGLCLSTHSSLHCFHSPASSVHLEGRMILERRGLGDIYSWGSQEEKDLQHSYKDSACHCLGPVSIAVTRNRLFLTGQPDHLPVHGGDKALWWTAPLVENTTHYSEAPLPSFQKSPKQSEFRDNFTLTKTCLLTRLASVEYNQEVALFYFSSILVLQPCFRISYSWPLTISWANSMTSPIAFYFCSRLISGYHTGSIFSNSQTYLFSLLYICLPYIPGQVFVGSSNLP